MSVWPLVPRLIRTAAAALVLLAAATLNSNSQASEAPAQRKTTQSESYVVIDPMYATILEGSRPRGLLMIEIGLDVPDGALRAQVSHALPTLRDAYVRSLIAYGATAVRVFRQPSVDDIAQRMQVITDRVMGKPGAKVLIAQTAMRVTR
jgi:flagellar basal body-associated protein FliL